MKVKINKRNAIGWLVGIVPLSVLSVLLFQENAMWFSFCLGIILSIPFPIVEPGDKNEK